MNVEYIHHCGDDLTVANAARVSFHKHHDALTVGDTGLIKYLANHKHFSPFNHCFVTFRVKAPIFVARQLVKHEYMPWNEVSRRYVDEEPELYNPEEWRGRAENKKQGSGPPLAEEEQVDIDFARIEAEIMSVGFYQYLLEKGVAPEQARMVLPQNLYTEWYWSGSLKAFAKMCLLRCTEDTQKETRYIANIISNKMGVLFPVSWAALREAEL